MRRTRHRTGDLGTFVQFEYLDSIDNYQWRTPRQLNKAIFNEGLKAVVAGVNPIQMKQGIEQAVEDITAELKKLSIKVKSTEEMAQVGGAVQVWVDGREPIEGPHQQAR